MPVPMPVPWPPAPPPDWEGGPGGPALGLDRPTEGGREGGLEAHVIRQAPRGVSVSCRPLRLRSCFISAPPPPPPSLPLSLSRSCLVMDFVPLPDAAASPRGAPFRARPRCLALPALSFGNAGQLAVDLFISHGACKAGYLLEPHVLPCVGNDPFGPSADGDLALALEVYEDAERNVTIVQQRAPVIKGTMMKFSKNLATWAAQEAVEEVIILAGLDSGKVQRTETNGSQIHYISTAKENGSDDRCEQLGWKLLQHYSPSSEAWQLLDHQAALAEDSISAEIPLTDDLYFPGQPFASLLACCKAQGLQVVCILCFCAEGDNVPDAFLIADGLNRFLNYGRKEPKGAGVTWKIPLSWTTVYGPPPDDTMFS